MFNPVSKLNWVYKYFFAGEPHKNTLIKQSSYKDNKFLDETTKKNLEDLANRNPAYYKIYALGEFATLDRRVFPKYETDILNKDDLKHLPSMFGLDYGYINDPSAFIHVKVDKPNKNLYIRGIRQGRHVKRRAGKRNQAAGLWKRTHHSRQC